MTSIHFDRKGIIYGFFIESGTVKYTVDTALISREPINESPTDEMLAYLSAAQRVKLKKFIETNK